MQVTATVLCSDASVAPSSIALNAVSAALMCSDLPWNGPFAAVHMAHNASDVGAGETVLQPSRAQVQEYGMSGMYVGTADTTLLADFQVSLHACSSHMAAVT